MSSGDFVILSKSELEIREKEIFFSAEEMETLIEGKEVTKKWLMKSIHKIKADIGNCKKYVGKEGEAYSSITCIQELIKSLDNTLEYYKEFIKEK